MKRQCLRPIIETSTYGGIEVFNVALCLDRMMLAETSFLAIFSIFKRLSLYML